MPAITVGAATHCGSAQARSCMHGGEHSSGPCIKCKEPVGIEDDLRTVGSNGRESWRTSRHHHVAPEQICIGGRDAKRMEGAQ